MKDVLREDLQVTFEEGTSAAWLYDLLKPHVTKLVVSDPRENKSVREANQSGKIDARRLAELLATKTVRRLQGSALHLDERPGNGSVRFPRLVHLLAGTRGAPFRFIHYK